MNEHPRSQPDKTSGRGNKANGDLGPDLEATARKPTETPAAGSSARPDAEFDHTVAKPGRKPAAGARPSTAAAAPAAKSGDQATAAPDPMLGTELGGCRIEALLGRGAMGAVYKARQLRLDRTVAVKVIRPELLTDQRVLRRFEVEARTIGRFNSPHVVMIHDVGFEAGVHYLVMEFVPGENLREHVRNLANGRLESAEAIDYLRQACEGLKEAQRLQVLHRDIKPDNLMLGERNVLKIADFGIAKPTHDDFNMTMTAELMGTPLYMSPEQCRATVELDFRSDMYSLGATFYYLLTGEPPAKASSIYELIETKTKLEFLSVAKALPEMAADHPLSRVIEKMTALDREDRYGSYDEILADLERIAGGAEPVARAARPGPAAPASRKGAGLRVVATLVVLVGGGLAAWRMLATREEKSVPSPISGGNTESKPTDTERLVAELQRLRADMATGSPAAGLRRRLDELVTPGAVANEFASLLAADVAVVERVTAELAEIRRPDPSPPFADLESFYADISRVAAVPTGSSSELAAWLGIAAKSARAEDALRPAAQAALLAAWVAWPKGLPAWQDAMAAGGHGADAQAALDRTKAELSGKLEAIAAGRSKLQELFPEAASVASEPSADAITDARAKLDAPVSLNPSPSVELQKARESFSPTPALRNLLENLRLADEKSRLQRDELLNAIGRADGVNTQLAAIRTKKPLPPDLSTKFKDIDDYFRSVDDVLKSLGNEPDYLRKWAEQVACPAARDSDALAESATATLTVAWSALRKDADAAGTDDAAVVALEPRFEQVRDARARMLALFPAKVKKVEEAVPEAASRAIAGRIDAAKATQRLLADIAEMTRRVGGLAGLAAWEEAAERTQKEFDELATATNKSGSATARAALGKLRDAVGNWRSALASAQGLVKDVAAGAFKKLKPPAGAPTAPELQKLSSAVEQCRGAFQALETDLDCAAAQAKLALAIETLGSLGTLGRPAAEKVSGLAARLAEMDSTFDKFGMSRIVGGTTSTPAGRADVKTFAMARTEVRQREYAVFLGELQAACKSAGPEARADEMLKLANARLGNLLPTTATLQQMLSRRSKLDANPDLPVDDLTWYEAAAFARFYRLALPTLPEWTLVALGPDNNRQLYPWGAKWSTDRNDRNVSEFDLVRVDDGGFGWRSDKDRRFHHLAGNVAEWLQADQASGKGSLAGGKFDDDEREAKNQAGGRPRTADLQQRRPGFGLRVALRPAEFFGDLWPQ